MKKGRCYFPDQEGGVDCSLFFLTYFMRLNYPETTYLDRRN